MKKNIIVLSIFIIALLGGALFYHNYLSWKPFRCNTHMTAHITTKNGNKLTLNLDIHVVTAQKGNSELILVGSLKELDKDYVISRRMFISIKPSNFKGVAKTIITQEELRPIDNLPDKLWQQYVRPDTPGVDFYTESKRLSENLFFIKGLPTPYLICALAND
ncbi:hypothetical protein [Serratia fonticola]|uniref:hypothetical protein n=1 Tax=Serratia fonticola TaxID=47917 RepID=UPI001645F90C|nr:hypothetical protein [Serratia fonticola]MBC3219742.1 hypothetical protein [Serratia fonticola]